MQLIEKYQDCLLDRNSTQVSCSLFGRTINFFWMHGERYRYKISIFRIFNICWMTLYEENRRYSYDVILSKRIPIKTHKELSILFQKRQQLDAEERQDKKDIKLGNILKT